MNFEPTLEFARQKDSLDELKRFRNEFHIPRHDGRESIYFCGNSLGLQPRNVARAIQQELDDWRNLAIDGYWDAKTPWLFYQHNFREPLARIVGCLPGEVTVMNALTVNLHLMLTTFYRPTDTRFKIMMEAGAFPSDQYAIETHLRVHGIDPEQGIIEISPREGEKIIRQEDIIDAIERHRASLNVVLLGGINYYTGQLFDMPMITAAAHAAGAVAGFDLAHAVGNVLLELHDWNVDFAVWCSYKYLNGGPGAVGGAYIHERYAADTARQRLAGWWGNEEATRFEMKKGFIPKADASAWNVSTAQVFNMVSLKASMEIFAKTSMAACRAKSLELTNYLEYLLGQIAGLDFSVITPADPKCRGAQLSLFFERGGKQIHEKMTQAGIVVDYREPGVIRVAPVPLYNGFEDVFQFYSILKKFQ